MAEAAYGALPFSEQIAYFRRKLNLTTEDWTQLFGAAHDHAFVVAGANRDDIVADFRAAIDKAITQGTTLEEFRRDFDAIVAKHGWSYKGSRGWRTQVIYDTNLRSSYMAGRWRQLQAIKTVSPYWEYVHSDLVTHPRPQHLAWNGLTLHADDPWWREHFPPNGWGCQCRVVAKSAAQLRDAGKEVDQAPPVIYQDVRVGKNGAHPRDVRVPEGVDPGFGHAPGATVPDQAWLAQQAEQAMAAGDAYQAGDWTRLVTTGPDDFGRPAILPKFKPPVELGKRLTDSSDLQQAVIDAVGAPQRIYDVRGLPLGIDAATLARHVDPRRAEFLPLLDDLLTNPYEVWLSLERNSKTGYYALRARVIKVYDLGGGVLVLLSAQETDGLLESWTFLPTSKTNYAKNQRMGYLWWGA